MKKDFFAILTKLKKRWWYLFLLVISSAYVFYYRNEIYQLNPLTVRNFIFLVWIGLLLLPIFSEIEFFGIKLKKELHKTTEEIKSSISNLQTQISQIQFSSSNATNLNVINGVLPSEEQLAKYIIMAGQGLEENMGNGEEDTKLTDQEDTHVFLFKVRFDIECALRGLCARIGYTDNMQINKMLAVLHSTGIIDGITVDLANQICKIANRGIHGEIISEKYIDFVQRTAPELISSLKAASDNLKYVTCNRCHYTGYSVYENLCPQCGNICGCE